MSKYNSSALTSGMTMGVDFLSQFQKRIVANGGSPLLIHHMTLPASAEKLDKLAKLAVAQHFPVPRSEIEREAYEKSLEQYDRETAENDKYHWWDIVGLKHRYGIPSVVFGGDDNPLIPKEIKEQICGKVLPYPPIIIFEGENHILISILASPHPEIENAYGEIDIMSIAPAKYFDLEH